MIGLGVTGPGPWRNSGRWLVGLVIGMGITALLCLGCGNDGEGRPSDPGGTVEEEAGVAPAAPPETIETVEDLRLQPWTGASGELAPAEVHTYRLELESGYFFHLEVLQEGVDLEARLLDSDDRTVVLSDRPTRDRGVEFLIWISGDRPEGPAEARVRYTLRLTAAAGTAAAPRRSGKYSLDLRVRRRPTPSDPRLAQVAAELSTSEELAWSGRTKASMAILESLESTLAALPEPGSPGKILRAEILERLGRGQASSGNWQESARAYSRAERALAEVGDSRLRATAVHHLGLAFFRQSRFDDAIEQFHRAFPMLQEVGDRVGEGVTASSLAHAYQIQGEVQLALEQYSRALELLDPTQNRSLRARCWHNLGVLYGAMGDRERAELNLLAAIEAWVDLSLDRESAASRNQLGRLYFESGSHGAAAEHFSEAVRLRRKSGDLRGQAAALARLGGVRQALGEPDRAREIYLEAYGLIEEAAQEIPTAGDVEPALAAHPRTRGEILRRLASLYLEERSRPAGDPAAGDPAAGDPAEASRLYGEALELYRRIGEPASQADCLVGLAKAALQQGDPLAALASSKRALDIFESLRARALEQSLRTSFYANVQDHFDFHLGILFELHTRQPDAGWAEQALLTSERARARSLADLLIEGSHGRPVDGAAASSEELLEQRLSSLETKLGMLEERRLVRRDGSRAIDPGRLARENRALAEVLAEIGQTRAELRARHPRLERLTDPSTGVVRDLDEIRRLLTATTASATSVGPSEGSSLRGARLLVYWLGESRSYVWWVGVPAAAEAGPGELIWQELPSRSLIEPRVRRAHSLLQRSHHRESRWASQSALCEVSQTLLGPIADRLASEELQGPLWVVPDGALHYLPFGVLPDPTALGGPGSPSCSEASPLLESHQLSYLPSASTLASLRGRERRAPEALLAVVADPVFGPADSRLAGLGPSASPGAQASPRAGSGGDRIRFEGLRRLEGTRAEAAVLMEVVGGMATQPDGLQSDPLALGPLGSRLFSGFDAHKAAILGGSLAPFRYLHFATHAVVEGERPGLSRILLSAVDSAGQQRDGNLRALEVSRLSLAADLVVLSACETALGQEIRGEGLVGLGQSFLAAGAGALVVSLWKVDDRATAELMERFYRGMLPEDRGRRSLAGLGPAAALRQAQLALRDDSQWSAPFHWAGFVLVGEPGAPIDLRATRPGLLEGR